MIRAFLECTFAIEKKPIDDWKASPTYSPCAPQPVAYTGAYPVMDGQPANQAQIQIAADRWRRIPRWNGHIHAIFGPFHALLKTFNAIGDLFANIIPWLIEIYRISAKRQDWYAHPGDSRQLEAEYPQILTFIYGSAAKHLADYLQRSPSVFEINQHMMNRAKKYPFCMVIVLYTRFAEVTKMMRKAESLGERGCVELYFTCLRFALPLFAMTHKTDYVRLINDYFVKWHCVSPAFKEIYRHFLYTQLTSTGFPIWLDLFMEMIIMDIRGYCGKVARWGLHKKLEYVVNQIPKRQRTGNVMESLRSGEQKEKATKSRTHLTLSDPIAVFE